MGERDWRVERRVAEGVVDGFTSQALLMVQCRKSDEGYRQQCRMGSSQEERATATACRSVREQEG